MIDQSKVTSGFDIEFLMTEEFIRYFLLCSLDTGSIPWASEASGTSGTPPIPYRTVTIIHPPEELHDRRLYPVFSEFDGHEHACTRSNNVCRPGAGGGVVQPVKCNEIRN